MKNHEWKSFVSYKEAIERVHCHSIAPTISWIWPQSNCKKKRNHLNFYSGSLTWHIDVSAREISKDGLFNLGGFWINFYVVRKCCTKCFNCMDNCSWNIACNLFLLHDIKLELIWINHAFISISSILCIFDYRQDSSFYQWNN